PPGRCGVDGGGRCSAPGAVPRTTATLVSAGGAEPSWRQPPRRVPGLRDRPVRPLRPHLLRPRLLPRALGRRGEPGFTAEPPRRRVRRAALPAATTGGRAARWGRRADRPDSTLPIPAARGPVARPARPAPGRGSVPAS